MTSTPDSFFAIAHNDDDLPPLIERDGYGRPQLLPGNSKHGQYLKDTAVTKRSAPYAPYSRASSLSDVISNFSGLHKWQKRLLAKGMGEREDLAAMASGLAPITGDRAKDRETNARLDEIIESALETAGATAKANYGTAVHAFTDPGEHGPVPERMQADVESYWDVMKRCGVRQIASEVFVANDEVAAAGTFDGLYLVPGYGLLVGDKKTGKQNMHSVAIQLATYNHAEVYDPETHTRKPLRELRPLYALSEEIRTDVALYIHIPAGEGKTTLHIVDTTIGWEMAQAAALVRDYHKRRDIVSAPINDELESAATVERQAIVEELLEQTSREEMLQIHARNDNSQVWTEELTQAVMIRLQQIADGGE